MINRKFYLSISVLGLLAMTLGQFMARPQFYGTGFGRAWAHVFWLGFLFFIVPLVALSVGYIAHHKNPLVVATGRYQLMGTAIITGFVGLVTIAAMVMGNEALTGYDGDARRGVFVVWLLLIVTLTIINLLILAIRQPRQVKRF
jgi:hypothetical protein